MTAPDSAPTRHRHMPGRSDLAALRKDFFTALGFLTRLPLPRGVTLATGDLRRAQRLFPLAGLVVGLIGALTFWLASRLGLGPWPAGALAVAATALATGALHEDGLSDTADGLGGGGEAARKLEIMRDSRLGSYGGLALILSVLLRVAALAALADPEPAGAALIAAHVASRGALPAVMAAVPAARPDGLAASVGAAGRPDLWFCLALTGVLVVLALGPRGGFFVLALVVLAAAAVARLARRQIGGVTGDVLGAVQQVAEATALLTVAALA
ncbi:MAG: adenosylcobinamide-GDP ribazoletransferase [Kiloniellales bacterium]|nr:adenosylcobinamide-GDP ribazoletransferase [Kiloniellales bacterium]